MGNNHQSPDTAPLSRSIWQAVDREVFERQTQALFAKSHVSGRYAYPPRKKSESDSLYQLPFEVEQSLVDDFAFIAAAQPQVQYVTAVALEQGTSKPSVTIRFAANEGIPPDVRKKLNEISSAMTKHARKDITQVCCQQQLLESILELNKNKIMGRLGSAWFHRPKHLGENQRPLPCRFRQLLERNIRQPFCHRRSPDLDRLDGQLKSFEVAFSQLEKGKSEDIISNTRLVVQRAFELTEDGTKLLSRLKDLGWPDSQLDMRAVREIGKVANYWRISRHLAVSSRRFRSQFDSAELHFLPSYSPSMKSKAIPAQYVHAEIQLLVHYELETLELKPRAIGVSKEACFLCDAFIRAHGRFSITGAHRQMFPQWTVPDLVRYQKSTIEDFRRVLHQVCVEVEREHLRSQQKTVSRPFPAQSAINLNVIHLITPSTSTLPLRSITSKKNDTDPVELRSDDGASISHEVTETLSAREQDSGNDPKESLLGRSLPGKHSNSTRSERELFPIPLEVVVDEDVSECPDWLCIFPSPSNSTNNQRPESEAGHFSKAVITLEPTTGAENHTIHLADIPLQGELVLKRDASDNLHQLTFHLIGNSRQAICVRCQWYNS